MPISKGKKWKAQDKLPGSVGKTEHLFVIRFTNEAFLSIQEYYQRLDLYHTRCWTCAVTGKTNLTFEEALVSEKATGKKLIKFPKEYGLYVLSKIQFSTKKLNELVEELHRLLKKKASSRKPDCPSKAMLRWFIRDATERHSYPNSPFLVKKAFAKKYNLPHKDMPKKFASAHQKYLEKMKFKAKKEKMKRKAEESELVSNRKKVKIVKDDAGHGHEKKKKLSITLKIVKPKKYKKPKTEKRKLIEWPIPSIDADPLPLLQGDLLMAWKFLNTFSKSIKLYPFPFDHFQLALLQTDTYNGASCCDLVIETFISLLSIIFGELPSDFPARENLRNFRTINNFNWERAVAIYLNGIRDGENASHIPECLEYITKNYYVKFSYAAATFEERIQLLKFLVDAVLESETIRLSLDEAVDDLHDLKRTWREEKADVKRRLRESKNPTVQLNSNGDESELPSKPDNESEAVVNVEKDDQPKVIDTNVAVDREYEEQQLKRKETRYRNATSFRISFLRHLFIGRDSHNRTYWNFDGNYPIGKLFVENEDGRWMYYCTPSELEKLISHLKSTGLTNPDEKNLYDNLVRDKENISAIMQKAIEELRKLTECRHSARLQTIVREKPYLGYDNKYVNLP